MNTQKLLSNISGIVCICLLVLGTKTASAETYFFHNDHLGTPQALTDSNQLVVWQGDYSPFGEITENTSTVEQNLRYPGQYFDAETGLHYNYFRDYDPSIGRYLESDPIGLADGPSLYAYVSGNPIENYDSFGLNKSDKWYGFNNRDFRDWAHQQKQDQGIPANKNYSKEDLENLWKQWNDEERPRGKGGKSGRGGKSRSIFKKCVAFLFPGLAATALNHEFSDQKACRIYDNTPEFCPSE